MIIDSQISAAPARWAVFSIFLQAGLIIGAWVPHVPLAKDRLGVEPVLIGFVAQISTLQIGLGLTVMAALVIALFARAVAPADHY